MPITAVILADSIAAHGRRLTTFQVRFPKFILGQLSRHRAFSLSARSSRAVPVARLIEEVETDPVVPRFGVNRKGMQAPDDLDEEKAGKARSVWVRARCDAVGSARWLAGLGAAKETVNRLLEPFAYSDCVLTATDFLNFFSLRIHPDAQAEIRDLAVAMARLYRDATPVPLVFGDWHLPYVAAAERAEFPVIDAIALSAARCARTSYVPHDAAAVDVPRDLARAAGLKRDRHLVPFEHQATPSSLPEKRSGNFTGWWQYRQLVPGNVATAFDFGLLDRYP